MKTLKATRFRKGFTLLEKVSDKINNASRHSIQSDGTKRDSLTGFTLVEMMVVLIIVAIVATLSALAYYTQVSKGKNNLAQSNLRIICVQEKLHYLDELAYIGAANLGEVNSALDLGLIDTAFSYSITASTTCFTAQAAKNDSSKTYRISQTGVLVEE